MAWRSINRYTLIIFFLMVGMAYAGPPSRTYTYTAGQIIEPAEVTTNEDNIYTYLQQGVDTYEDSSITSTDILDGTIATADIANSAITSALIADGTVTSADITNSTIVSADIVSGAIVNRDINESAAIEDIKLGHISTAGKVSGSSFLNLDSTPSGAGKIPNANINIGTGNSQVVATNTTGAIDYAIEIDAGSLASNTVPNARLATTGTAGTTTFLSGARTWVSATQATIGQEAISSNRTVHLATGFKPSAIFALAYQASDNATSIGFSNGTDNKCMNIAGTTGVAGGTGSFYDLTTATHFFGNITGFNATGANLTHVQNGADTIQVIWMAVK